MDGNRKKFLSLVSDVETNTSKRTKERIMRRKNRKLMLNDKTKTRGNVVIEDIQIGDIHYEYEYGLGIKSQVQTKPVLNEDGAWVWKSINLTTKVTIDYLVHPKYAHYSSKLYNYEAYSVDKYI